jgi:hypothetical protein
MPTHQGDVGLLNDPVAQQLLQSKFPARLAYVWSDGTPRVVPIWFHWNGSEIVLAGPPNAPKMKVLTDGTKVALTIDNDTMPHKVLLIRGSVRTDKVEGMAPEYAAAARRYLGNEGGDAWVGMAGGLMTEMGRIFVTPEWVGVMDFEARFPNALERAMEQAQSGG